MCVHLHTFPDECLLLIFDRISLGELLRLDQVCSRWWVLLPSACARRRTLTLAFGRSDVPGTWRIPVGDHLVVPSDGGLPYTHLPVSECEAILYLPNLLSDATVGCQTEAGFTELACLHKARLAGQLVTYLTDLFPNVHTLVVLHRQCFEEELNLLVGLLASSSWSLVTLKLCLQTKDIDQRYLDRPDQHPVGPLLHSINSQRASLQQVTLDICGDTSINNHGRPVFTFPMESFAFIAQLKVAKLSLNCYDLHNSVWDILHRYDTGNLNQLVITTTHTLRAALHPEFRSVKVRKLYWNWWMDSAKLLGQVCLRFSSLTVLQLNWSPAFITFTELVANLALLRQLAQLVICIDFEGDHHHENPFALADRLDVEEEEPRRISLPQVKILALSIRKHDHNDFESFSSSVFPSIEKIILLNLTYPDRPKAECAICRPNINGQHDTQVAKQCFQLLARSLRNKFANQSVLMNADGVNVKFESAFESFKTVAILVAIYIGLPFLFQKMRPNSIMSI